jgi:hypothetical protein
MHWLQPSCTSAQPVSAQPAGVKLRVGWGHCLWTAAVYIRHAGICVHQPSMPAEGSLSCHPPAPLFFFGSGGGMCPLLWPLAPCSTIQYQQHIAGLTLGDQRGAHMLSYVCRRHNHKPNQNTQTKGETRNAACLTQGRGGPRAASGLPRSC